MIRHLGGARTAMARSGAAATALLLVAACSGDTVDVDLRGSSGGFDTTDAAAAAQTQARPAPDARGVISYPNFQVAVARRGDNVGDVASRVGLPTEEVARFNGLPEAVALRDGEVVVLPRRVDGAPATSPGGVDVGTLAGEALDRVESGTPNRQAPEPVRHRVAEGETAFSIARRYGVPVDALARWNGLGTGLDVRVGQVLLIPPPVNAPAGQTGGVETAALPPETSSSRPGQGTATPAPPSAAAPLPSPAPQASPQAAPQAAAEPEPEPAAPPPPELEPDTGETSSARLQMPVTGPIIQPYQSGTNEGINISAPAGSPVRAAAAGTVAAITRDTDQVPILVLRHADNLLTVYAGVDNVMVERGDEVARGAQIASVRDGGTPFLHFEVRDGFESVDPEPYLR